MATLDDIADALQNAHAAGDTDAATALANAYADMQGQQSAAPPPPAIGPGANASLPPDNYTADYRETDPLAQPGAMPLPQSTIFQRGLPSTGALEAAGGRLVDAAKGAATTALTGIPGFLGDTESIARLAMSPFGVSRTRDPNAMGLPYLLNLPTTDDIANNIAGPAANPYEAGGRAFGGFASPLLAAKAAQGAANATRRAAGLIPANVPPDIRAQMLLNRAYTADNVSPQNAADTIAQFGDKPITPMDVGGSNVARLARTVNTLPGSGSEQISHFLAERQADQGGRVLDDISGNLADGSNVYDQSKQLMADRAAASRPAYGAAFEGGSIAPLQDQLRDELISATGKMGALQKQITAIEQNNPGALASRGAAGAQTRAQYMDLHQQLQQAQNDRQSVLKMFQQSQSDAATNAPGAVWSPRIQQFLDSPEVQQGIQRGLNIQRIEALGKGDPFNPTEYGVTGTDDAGNPIVSNVPNMRLLDAGKRGLDAMIADHTDTVTGKVDEMGRALTILRNGDPASEALGYVPELDRLNPLYKAARDAYSGPSQSIDALNAGRRFLTMSPEQIADRMANMGESDQQFFRMGGGRALQDLVNGMPDGADATKRVWGNNTIRSRIGAMFGPDATAQFSQAMTPEKLATMTNQFVRGGSNSANKLADIADVGAGAEIAKDAVLGAMSGGVHGAVSLPLLNYGRTKVASFFNGMSPAVRAQLGGLLTSTGPNAISAINSLANAGQIAAPVGNAGVSGIAAIANSPVIRALLAQRAALTLAPPPPNLGR